MFCNNEPLVVETVLYSDSDGESELIFESLDNGTILALFLKFMVLIAWVERPAKGYIFSSVA